MDNLWGTRKHVTAYATFIFTLDLVLEKMEGRSLNSPEVVIHILII